MSEFEDLSGLTPKQIAKRRRLISWYENYNAASLNKLKNARLSKAVAVDVSEDKPRSGPS